MRTLLIVLGAVILLSAAAFLVSCAAPGQEVTREEYGESWPLTVDTARVWCESPGLVLLEAEGTTYGLNGTALNRDYPPVDPIWRDDPSMPAEIEGVKVSIRPLLNRGLEMCYD